MTFKKSFYAPDQESDWRVVPNRKTPEQLMILSPEAVQEMFPEKYVPNGLHWFQVVHYAGLAWSRFWVEE